MTAEWRQGFLAGNLFASKGLPVDKAVSGPIRWARSSSPGAPATR